MLNCLVKPKILILRHGTRCRAAARQDRIKSVAPSSWAAKVGCQTSERGLVTFLLPALVQKFKVYLLALVNWSAVALRHPKNAVITLSTFYPRACVHVRPRACSGSCRSSSSCSNCWQQMRMPWQKAASKAVKMLPFVHCGTAATSQKIQLL